MRMARVERGVRILEHHADAPTQLPQAPARGGEQVLAIEGDAPADAVAQQAQQGATERALAAAAFTEQGQAFAAAQFDRHVLHRRLRRARVLDAQLRNVEQALADSGRRDRGQVIGGQQLARVVRLRGREHLRGFAVLDDHAALQDRHLLRMRGRPGAGRG